MKKEGEAPPSAADLHPHSHRSGHLDAYLATSPGLSTRLTSSLSNGRPASSPLSPMADRLHGRLCCRSGHLARPPIPASSSAARSLSRLSSRIPSFPHFKPHPFHPPHLLSLQWPIASMAASTADLCYRSGLAPRLDHIPSSSNPTRWLSSTDPFRTRSGSKSNPTRYDPFRKRRQVLLSLTLIN